MIRNSLTKRASLTTTLPGGKTRNLPPWRWVMGLSTITPTMQMQIISATFPGGEIRIYAHRTIEKDEEITINYGGRPDCPDPVWFDVVGEDG